MACLLSSPRLRNTLAIVRQVVTRRWLFIHALVVGAVLLFLALGWWQLQRADAGNTRSVAYMLEWPTFALMVVGFWIKIIHDELHPESDSGAEVAGETASIAGQAVGTEASTRRRPDRRSDEERAELATYNRYMADLANQRDRR